MTVFWTEIQKTNYPTHLSGKSAEDAQKFATGIYLYLIEPENHTIMTDCYTDNAIPGTCHSRTGAVVCWYGYFQQSTFPTIMEKLPINASADAWYFTSI